MSIEVMKMAVGQFEYILERINRNIIPHDGDEFHETLTALRQAIKDEEESFRPDYDTNAVLLERIREIEAQLERQQAEKQDADQWYEKALWGEKQETLTGLAETSREIEQEPVAVMELGKGGWDIVESVDVDWLATLPVGTKLYNIPMSTKQENIDTKTAHVDPVDIEPVTNLIEKSKHNFQRNFGTNGYANWIYADLENLIRTNSFYATPPKREWQSLTDNEIIWIENSTPSRSYNDHARAIEAKLKELNT